MSTVRIKHLEAVKEFARQLKDKRVWKIKFKASVDGNPISETDCTAEAYVWPKGVEHTSDKAKEGGPVDYTEDKVVSVVEVLSPKGEPVEIEDDDQVEIWVSCREKIVKFGPYTGRQLKDGILDAGSQYP